VVPFRIGDHRCLGSENQRGVWGEEREGEKELGGEEVDRGPNKEDNYILAGAGGSYGEERASRKKRQLKKNTGGSDTKRKTTTREGKKTQRWEKELGR